MILTLRALNDDATLNNWQVESSVQAVRGSDVKIILQLMQADRKIRYIPDVAAVITVDLIKSDATILTKTLTIPLADDRSITQLNLSAAETAVLISQNLIVKVVEGPVTSIAILQQGLQMVAPNQVGC